MEAEVTFYDLLRGINAYPIPPTALIGIAAVRGLDLEEEVLNDSVASDSWRLARADVLMWLADAPNVAQGGQNYSFTDEQRKRFRDEAQAVYDELEPDEHKAKYGYKGSRL